MYIFNLQDQFFQVVLRTLMSIRQNQVEPVLARLDGDQLDLLMKYVYRGFESPSDGSSGLSETLLGGLADLTKLCELSFGSWKGSH